MASYLLQDDCKCENLGSLQLIVWPPLHNLSLLSLLGFQIIKESSVHSSRLRIPSPYETSHENLECLGSIRIDTFLVRKGCVSYGFVNRVPKILMGVYNPQLISSWHILAIYLTKKTQCPNFSVISLCLYFNGLKSNTIVSALYHMSYIIYNIVICRGVRFHCTHAINLAFGIVYSTLL